MRLNEIFEPVLDEVNMSPGALAYYVLWTSPSMAQGIRNFKSQYKL
jgi:hypothetical protein